MVAMQVSVALCTCPVTVTADHDFNSQLTSEGDVYSTISVHKLLHLIVPRFCWFDLRLHASLYSIYGVPVST
jgi:hypothetical protein